MKRILVIILLLIIFGGGGFYYYQNFYQRSETSLIELVPETAFGIYTNPDFANSWNTFLETSFWQNLSRVEKYQRVNRDIALLDSMSGSSGNLAKLLRDENFIVSFHVTSRNSYDFVYYVDLHGEQNAEIAVQLLDHFQSQEGTKIHSRVLQGITINEIEGPEGQEFSYIIEENLFAGSFTSFLVEDVVRNIREKFSNNFVSANGQLLQLPASLNDEGNLLLNYDGFIDFLKTFARDEQSVFLKQASGLLHSLKLDLTVNENEIAINGFGTIDPESRLNLFNEQAPREFSLRRYVSNRTALHYQVGLSNPLIWHDATLERRTSDNDPWVDSLKNYQERYDLNVERWINWTGSEIGLSIMESVNPENPDQIMLVKCSDITDALNQLNQVTDRVNNSLGDTLYYEFYGESEIRQLPLHEIPRIIYGEPFNNFDLCFYTAVNNVLVISNNVESIRTLLRDIENEEVWEKSVDQEEFLERSIQQSNLSFYINTSRAWNLMKALSNDQFSSTLDEYASQFRRFDKLAIQLSNVDNRYFTAITVKHQEIQPVSVQNDFEYQYRNQFDPPVVTRPFMVRNHNTGKLEVLIQDAGNNLILVADDGEILWKDSVSGRITSDVHQIDYYRNNKLQYLFASGNRIFLIDRNGDPVAGFPLEFDYDIDRLNVIDYDNSKRYRIMTSDKYGNIFLYDRNGKMLEGWDPLKLENRLASDPFHLRVRSRDFMIAMEENGRVNIMNRRGEMMDGFPLSLNSLVSNSLFVELGSTYNRTFLSTVTDKGEVVRFDLQGTIAGQLQLYRPDRESEFMLVPDALKKTYVIARKDQNRLTFMTREGTELFQKDYISSGELELQYYNFGSGNEIFVVADQSQDVTYLYDGSGELINARPLSSGFPIAMIYSSRQGRYQVYFSAADYQGIAVFYR